MNHAFEVSILHFTFYLWWLYLYLAMRRHFKVGDRVALASPMVNDPAPDRPLYLHVGFGPDDYEAAAKIDRLGLLIDGDSWELWGETRKPGEAGHVIAEVDGREDALFSLATLAGFFDLVPMEMEDQAGTLAVVTPADDWSEPVLVVEQTGAWML